MARIPRTHPRYASLKTREALVKGFRNGIACEEGLIAQGRGEAFDYLIGERTKGFAREAIEAAAGLLLLAKSPVISVNGNLAALCPGAIVAIGRAAGTKIEVNLFYRTGKRARAIGRCLRASGAKEVLGTEGRLASIPELFSERRRVSREGIYCADVVLLAMEDGDRTRALRRMGKKVIAIDLNPLSVTAREADVTIIDNAIRAMPALVKEVERLRGWKREKLVGAVKGYDNGKAREAALAHIAKRLLKLSKG